MAASAKRAKQVNIRDAAAVATFLAQSLEWIERYLKNSPEDFHQYDEVNLSMMVLAVLAHAHNYGVGRF